MDCRLDGTLQRFNGVKWFYFLGHWQVGDDLGTFGLGSLNQRSTMRARHFMTRES